MFLQNISLFTYFIYLFIEKVNKVYLTILIKRVKELLFEENELKRMQVTEAAVQRRF